MPRHNTGRNDGRRAWVQRLLQSAPTPRESTGESCGLRNLTLPEMAVSGRVKSRRPLVSPVLWRAVLARFADLGSG